MNKPERARANQRFIRQLLEEKQPDYAAALNAAVLRHYCCGASAARPAIVDAVILLAELRGFKEVAHAG